MLNVLVNNVELLKITLHDPLEYAKQRVKEYNENIKNSKVEYNITVNFDDKVINQGNTVSKSTCRIQAISRYTGKNIF